MTLFCSAKRQKGQILPIAAAAFLIMCGLAGLAIDASRDYLTKRNAQNAADFSTLAAAKQMTLLNSINSPIAANSNTVMAAHDFAQNNGFNTIYSNGCDVSTGTSFSATWFDVGGPACGATTGFTNKVTLNSPPVNLPGSPVPSSCLGSGKFSCVQVVITARIPQLFTSMVGIPFAYVTVGASAQAALPSSAFDAPPPNALTLYQPQAGCDKATQQCFDETKVANRAALACTGGTNNCPTLWVQTGAASEFDGYDGSVYSPARDLTAVQSNGDVVLQTQTTFCDPYNGGVCALNTAKGAAGFAVPAGTKLYCTGYGAGAGTTACTNSVQPSLNKIYGNQAGWQSPTAWYPTVSLAGLPVCGGLILNGGPVTGGCADPVEKYTVQPGIYTYIVINHGTYGFESGLYDITGKAPVNTASGGAYIANGIDHSKETLAGDFDLCTAGTATGCPTLTAGVWIGHGGGGFGAYVTPIPPVCNSNQVGTDGGGGDPTIVSGSGVVFRMESTSGGFVSTNEVTGLALAGASIGGLDAVNGTPLLIDEENNSFIHIDATPPQLGGAANTIAGIVYQTANATGGGFEINLGMNGLNGTSIQGQVLAYTFTSFGTGGQMDFTGGYGTASLPPIQTSGKSEPSIVQSVALTAAGAGYSTLTVNYTDEWMMDGFDVYVKVNNGSPIFFSQGIWTTTPLPTDPLPPPANNPGDQFPAYHSAANSGLYTINPSDPTDWTFAIPNSNGSTVEAKGQWNWGHHKDIPNAVSGNYTAKMLYTFPNPVGSYLSITVFLLDGDRCGDYAYSTYTFKNTGLPGPGAQSIGSVGLVQ
ncbi:MAG TPA: pilus assembly protein TadG-related protein [Candidatus Dormibacteraeota bacterium]